MYRIFLLSAFVLCLFSTSLKAQFNKLEISAFGGYTFGDKFPMSYATGRVDGGSTYGAMLNFFPRENYGIGLMYTYMPTFLEINGRVVDLPPNGYRRINGDVHFVTIGGIRRMVVGSGNTAINGSANIGMAILNATDPGTSYSSASEVMFAGGLNLWLDQAISDRIGIKLMASLQVPMQFAGAGVSIGTGGPNVGMSSYSNILIFGFMGGLNVQLGE